MHRLREHWDRIAGWSLVVIGAIALVIGWFGVSGTVFPAEQLSYIASGGLAGIFCLGLGATLLLSADLRDEWILLAAMHREREVPSEGDGRPVDELPATNGHAGDDATAETRELALASGE